MGLICLQIFLTCMLMVTLIGLVTGWIIGYGGNFIWDDNRRHTKLQHFPIKFNFHPILMTGFFVSTGFSTIIYRITKTSKMSTKLIHTFLHSVSISFALFGLLIIYEAKENAYPFKTQHFYSLHSWIGLGTIVLFIGQYIFGFFTFLLLLCCNGTEKYRLRFKQTHSILGLLVFILASSAILIGITEVAFHSLKDADVAETRYRLHEPEAFMINLIGIVVVVIVACVVWILKNRRGKQTVSARL